MNKDIFQSHWHEFKGKLKQKWGSLTEDKLSQINGKREELLGKLQQKYGWTKEKAETELKHFMNQFSWSKEEESHAKVGAPVYQNEKQQPRNFK